MIVPGVGHWIAEEAPEALLGRLTPFLAPFLDSAPMQSEPSPRAAAAR